MPRPRDISRRRLVVCPQCKRMVAPNDMVPLSGDFYRYEWPCRECEAAKRVTDDAPPA